MRMKVALPTGREGGTRQTRLVEIVSSYLFCALTKVAVFRSLYRVAIDDLRYLLDRALPGGAGDGENRKDFLDQLFFEGGVLPC
jgi:hypothetical protein